MEAIGRLGPRVPTLGVCLGHQCVGQVYGGRIVRAPAVVHGKVSRIRHDGRELFAGLPSNYDSMAGVLSFWQDPRWRRFMVSRVQVPAGARVLDVATGTGAVAMEVAAKTGAHVVGIDQSEEMLGEGVSRTRRAGFEQRIRFVLGRGERLGPRRR